MKTTFSQRVSEILKLGFPILVGQLGFIVVAFADNIMVGSYSTPALASASFVNNIFNVVNFSCMGFALGFTPLVGALFGAGNREKIGALTRNALAVNTIFGALLCVIMGLLYLALPHLGQPPELLPLIRPYYLLALASIVTTVIFGVFSQWCYGIRNTSTPMWIILFTNALNILGNWILIFGNWGMPELGLTGAGISTLASKAIGATAMAAYFFIHPANKIYSRTFHSARLILTEMRHITRTALPVAVQTCCEATSFSTGALMAGWIGTIELAAFQIIVVVGTLGFTIYYSFGGAVAILVANAAGKSDKTAQRRYASAGYTILLAIMSLSCMTFILAGRHLMGVFTPDKAVIDTATAMIVPLVIYQLADATQINYSSALRGTSHVMPMLWIAIVSYIIIGIPATYLLAFPTGWGLYGIILSFTVSLASAALLFRHFFMRVTAQKKSAA